MEVSYVRGRGSDGGNVAYSGLFLTPQQEMSALILTTIYVGVDDQEVVSHN
jgi:hypothetical protein